MKIKIFIILGLAAILTGITGCYKDVIYPDFDPNAPISFSGDLVPIFEKSCASSGCHDAVPAHSPALTPDKAYNAIVNGGYINTLAPEQSIIYLEVKSGSMPPSGGLKPTDAQKILNWIKGGAPNN